jgi:hypothetical protein
MWINPQTRTASLIYLHICTKTHLERPLLRDPDEVVDDHPVPQGEDGGEGLHLLFLWWLLLMMMMVGWMG